MKIVYKKRYMILNQNNEIKLSFFVDFNKEKNGIDNFDINDIEEKINNFFEKIENGKIIYNTKYPIYYSLSILLFEHFQKLEEIEFINDNFNSIINKTEI